MAVCVCVDVAHLNKAARERYTQYYHWMRTSINWEMVRFSSNLTPTVVCGRFPWMPSQNCSQPLPHHLDFFVSLDSHLVSAPPQRSSNVPGPRYLRAWRRPSVRLMMSSFMGRTSQNLMDVYELFKTTYKKLS